MCQNAVMPLSDEHHQIIIDAVNEKSTGPRFLCPISGDSNWGVSDTIAIVPTINTPDNISALPTTALPLAIMSCNTCGYSMFLNLIKLGLAERLGIVISDG